MAKVTPRKYTTKLLKMVDEGLLDPREQLQNALGYMSEDEVKDFCQCNDLSPDMFPDEEDDEGED